MSLVELSIVRQLYRPAALVFCKDWGLQYFIAKPESHLPWLFTVSSEKPMGMFRSVSQLGIVGTRNGGDDALFQTVRVLVIRSENTR